jgi:hypothetical protein
MLRYDVGIFKDEIGCISPKMTVTDEEQLLDIGRFMTALNPVFLPENNATRTEYTFQLLEQTLEHFKISKYWEFIFQTILFDSIISNTDRHQENWAFIGQNTIMSSSLLDLDNELKDKNHEKTNWFFKWLHRNLFSAKKNKLHKETKQIILETINISKTAPIFDSGSSLARELTDEKIDLLLSNQSELNKYIENGKAELHWNGKKITHFGLIQELLNSSHRDEVLKAADFLKKWHNDLIIKILENAEKQIPEKWKSYSIPHNRKALIIKLITLRWEKLNKLINDRLQ